MSELITKVKYCSYVENERVKNKKCRICGCDEILKNDIDITTHAGEDILKEKH